MYDFAGTAVDQLLYRWSQRSLTGHRGVGPVASSMSEEATEHWDRLLRERVWVELGSKGDLTFLCFGTESAVIHRVAVTDPSGRDGSPLAHVLISPDLTAWMAAGLSDWEGWIETNAAADSLSVAGLPTVEFDPLRQVAIGGFQRLRVALGDRPPDLLTDLVTHMFANPAATLSVVDSPISPTELVCGLVDILGESDAAPLTFSTAEKSDAGTGLPRIVFLADSERFSTTAAKRQRVRLNPDRVDSASLAALVTNLYLRSGPEAVNRLRGYQALSAPDDVELMAKRVQLVPGVLADVTDLLTRIGSGALSEAEQGLLGSQQVSCLEPLLRVCGSGDLEAILAEWRDHPLAWERYPAVCRMVRAEAVTRGVDALDVVLGAPGIRPAGDVARVLNSLPEVQDGKLPVARLCWLLDLANNAGVHPRDQVDLMRRAIAENATDTVLRWVAKNSRELPQYAEVVLGALVGRTHTARQRRRNRAVLEEHHGFTDVIESIRPQEQLAAVGLFTVVIDTTFGTEVNKVRVLAPLLGSLTTHPHPALLYVLHKRISKDRPRLAVLNLVGEQYFGQQGFASQWGQV